MTRSTVTMMVEQDVYKILQKHKKRQGVQGTRGTYVERAVRYYEEQLSYDDEIRAANTAAHGLRTVAREMHIRAQNVAHLLTAAMAQLDAAGVEFKHPGAPKTDTWLNAQDELEEISPEFRGETYEDHVKGRSR